MGQFETTSVYDYILSIQSMGDIKVPVDTKNIGALEHYIQGEVSEERALAHEIAAYNLKPIGDKNAEILFCAFQLVHKAYLNARKVNPEDTQSGPSN